VTTAPRRNQQQQVLERGHRGRRQVRQQHLCQLQPQPPAPELLHQLAAHPALGAASLQQQLQPHPV
jgi:hypothetical protein